MNFKFGGCLFWLMLLSSLLVSGKVEAKEYYDCGKGIHQYNVVIISPAKEDRDGVREYTCAICGEVNTEAIPMYGHIWGEWVVDKPADCVLKGHQYRHCVKNEHTDIREERTIPATGHSYGKWIIDRKSSETAEGHKYRVCSNDNSHRVEMAIPKQIPVGKSPSLDTLDVLLISGSGIELFMYGLLIYWDMLVLLWHSRQKKQTLKRCRLGASLYEE